MKVIRPSFEILTPLDGMSILKQIELIGRVCYKSEDKITNESCVPFVKGLLKRGHESVIEHIFFSVRFICDRGVSHEIVRHRIASFSQESTRYCNYSGSEVTFILPEWFSKKASCPLLGDGVPMSWTSPPTSPFDSFPENEWYQSMLESEYHYNRLLEWGWTPQQARSVLPNSLKTEIVMTANLREWRHFFKLRTAPAAHPQMREVTIPLLNELKKQVPVIFDDIDPDEKPESPRDIEALRFACKTLMEENAQLKDAMSKHIEVEIVDIEELTIIKKNLQKAVEEELARLNAQIDKLTEERDSYKTLWVNSTSNGGL